MDGDRHPTPHGHSVDALARRSCVPIGSFESPSDDGVAWRDPRNIGGLYQLSFFSSSGRHLPQQWTQLHVLHSGPPPNGVPTIHQLHKNVPDPGAYCSISHRVSLIPALPWVPRRSSVEPLIPHGNSEQSPTLVRRSKVASNILASIPARNVMLHLKAPHPTPDPKDIRGPAGTVDLAPALCSCSVRLTGLLITAIHTRPTMT